jgi:hypothetical protein
MVSGASLKSQKDNRTRILKMKLEKLTKKLAGSEIRDSEIIRPGGQKAPDPGYRIRNTA